jgi:hypothetical protein
MAHRWGIAWMLGAMSFAGITGGGLAGAQMAPPQHSDPAKRPPGDPASRAGYWLAERKPVIEDLPGGSTAAQAQAAAASALQLEHILRGDPALVKPAGFVAGTNSSIGGEPSFGAAAPGDPIPSTVHLQIWEYAYGDSTDFQNVPWGLDVLVNQPRCMHLRPVASFGAKVTDSIFYKPHTDDQVHGYPRYRAGADEPGVIVMSRSSQPEWVPVSAERFLTYQIAVARAAGVVAGPGKVEALQSELAHLAPAARQAPAMIDLSATQPSGLAHEGELLTAIVAPNPAFLDRALSRGAPQVVCIAYDPPGSGDSEFPQQLFEKMTEQFPWQAVAGWLRGS